MPFSIPSRLVDFEYLGGGSGEVDEEYNNMAKDYQKEIDFAFFVVNFQYSKADYEALTPKEKIFIMKAWETKLVSDTTHIRNATLNAVSNAMRKKGSKFADLWTKKQQRLDTELAHNNLRIVEKIENNNDKSWVDKVYKANGMRKPEEKGGK